MTCRVDLHLRYCTYTIQCTYRLLVWIQNALFRVRVRPGQNDYSGFKSGSGPDQPKGNSKSGQKVPILTGSGSTLSHSVAKFYVPDQGGSGLIRYGSRLRPRFLLFYEKFLNNELIIKLFAVQWIGIMLIPTRIRQSILPPTPKLCQVDH